MPYADRSEEERRTIDRFWRQADDRQETDVG
jgi:hypothetical protein